MVVFVCFILEYYTSTDRTSTPFDQYVSTGVANKTLLATVCILKVTHSSFLNGFLWLNIRISFFFQSEAVR